MEFWTLDGLERSGRPVGIISTYFRRKRSGGFRVMTKKPIISRLFNSRVLKFERTVRQCDKKDSNFTQGLEIS